jgi:glucokinase
MKVQIDTGDNVRTRFQAKGRFVNYLKAIPTYVITRPVPALLGAAKYLRQL